RKWFTPECEGHYASQNGFSDQYVPGNTTASQRIEIKLSQPDQTERPPAISNNIGESSTLFAEEYGKFIKILHYDDSNTVQLYKKKATMTKLSSSSATYSETSTPMGSRRPSKSKSINGLFAVKVFRHSQTHPDPPTFPRDRSRPLSPCHPNIVLIIDIIYNKQSNLCLVMPYYTGGNLKSFLIQNGKRREHLSTEEKDCLYIQILRAVCFLHENGIAHGDMRPEHVFLTAQGAVKVGGFGENEEAVRAMAGLPQCDDTVSSISGPLSSSALGHDSKPTRCIRRRLSELSLPYLPPERGFDCRDARRQSYVYHNLLNPMSGDIWACGIIYIVLRTGWLLWYSAQVTDHDKAFAEYLHCRMEEDGYGPIQTLEKRCRNVIYAMLHPDSGLRITASEVLRSEWALTIMVCEAGERGL
ncbi:kinase-like domain-containing protein, partial [Penicillium sp. IBT 31633x]